MTQFVPFRAAENTFYVEPYMKGCYTFEGICILRSFDVADIDRSWFSIDSLEYTLDIFWKSFGQRAM